MRGKNRYEVTGASLLLSGLLLSLAGFLVFSIEWLTALGIAMLIMGAILVALSRTVPTVSPEVCSLLLETGLENIAAIIEELGITSRAIYLPSSMTGGRPQALLPLQLNGHVPDISRKLPQRLIVQSGPAHDDIGLLVSTVGTAAFGLLDNRPGPGPAELDSALTYLLSGVLGIADRTWISYSGRNVTIEIASPRIRQRANWAHQFIGEPLASIAATMTAEALGKPVVIEKEGQVKGRYVVVLGVQDGHL